MAPKRTDGANSLSPTKTKFSQSSLSGNPAKRKEVLEWIQSHPIGVNLENVKALENGTAPVKCIESRNENKI